MTRPDGAEEPAEGVDAGAARAAGLDRRRFLRGLGRTGSAVVAGGLLAHELLPGGRAPAAAAQSDPYGHAADPEAPSIGGGGGPARPIAERSGSSGLHYGHGAGTPPGLRDGDLDRVTVPPGRRAGRGVVEHEIVVTERQLEVAAGVVMDAWTYGGTVPGPILRGTVGDRLRVRLVNRTGHAHNLHLHGRHSPQMDGWQPIAAGDEFTYEWELGPVGVHPYHCHTAPLAEHVSRGLYGALIVDPVDARETAHEFVLVLSGFDVDRDGQNEVVAWNGVAGYFATFPITVPVGELVRLYVLNMTEFEPVGSFHLHAQTFDCYRSGTGRTPDEHTDTVTFGQGERAILEFRLPERGRYMFHPHQHHLADRGAMGWFAAV